MRPYQIKLVAAFLILCGTLLLQAQSAHAATSSGLDTINGNQVFAVEGTKVGEWSPSQLSVVGGLTATGAVQVGQTNVACTTDNEGAQRYNKTTKQIEFCNGTVWTTASGGSSGSLCGYYHGVQVPGDVYYVPGTAVVRCSGDYQSGYSWMCPSGYTMVQVSNHSEACRYFQGRNSGADMTCYIPDYTCAKN